SPRHGQVAVLGLGRMGAAMARRLQAQEWGVIGWHRSGAPVDGVEVETELEKAIAGAQVVLLSLFDDAACAAVLARVGAALPPGTAVVNTSTTSPEAAARFAADLGPAYVHAPVLGSVPAVTSGSLEILAGGDPARVEALRPVLAALGHIVHVGQPATAAAVKL